MIRKTPIALCLVLLLTLMTAFGCSSHEAPPMDMETLRSNLVGKTWQLQDMFTREVSEEPALTIKFTADGNAAGFGGCNNFRATYTLEGDELKFGPLASTRKACGAALSEQEFTYMTFLATIRKVEIVDEELHLFNGQDPKPMVFVNPDASGLW